MSDEKELCGMHYRDIAFDREHICVEPKGHVDPKHIAKDGYWWTCTSYQPEKPLSWPVTRSWADGSWVDSPGAQQNGAVPHMSSAHYDVVITWLRTQCKRARGATRTCKEQMFETWCQYCEVAYFVAGQHDKITELEAQVSAQEMTTVARLAGVAAQTMTPSVEGQLLSTTGVSDDTVAQIAGRLAAVYAHSVDWLCSSSWPDVAKRSVAVARMIADEVQRTGGVK